MDLNTPIISKIIDNWIDEDIGRGDLTSSSITEENGNAYWIAKEEGIFCGVEIIKEIFIMISLFIRFYTYITVIFVKLCMGVWLFTRMNTCIFKAFFYLNFLP